MELRPTKRFTKSLKKLDYQSQKAVKKAMMLLLKIRIIRHFEPEKWRGTTAFLKPARTWTFGSLLHYEKPDVLVLQNCGHHDDTLSNP